jgi:hypothetical protein
LFTQEELLLARTTFPGYNPKKGNNVGYGIVSKVQYQDGRWFYEQFNISKEKRYLLF